MFKKLLTVVACGLCVCAVGGTTAQAAERISSNVIPDQMEANALIEYAGNGIWSLLEGTDALESMAIEDVDEEEKTGATLAFNRFSNSMDDLKVKLSTEPVYDCVMPNPEVGMRVEYDNWGEVEKIFVLDNGEYKEIEQTFVKVSEGITKSSLISTYALPKGNRKAVGTYKYGKVVQKTKDKVGYTTNTIKITKNSVTGTGDFTVFTDKTGDHDNILKKGDCATKGSIDNPASNTKIKVTNKLKGITATFKKNDNGSLNNAVIDIWKTGVTNLGVTSKNYDNIKEAAKYTYSY